MTTHDSLTIYRFILISVCAFIAANILVPYVSAFPSVIMEDDGYFYAEIARNLVLTGRSTFDGIHTTSGFHLLWMGLLAVVGYLSSFISTDTNTFLVSFLTFNFIICFAYTFLYFPKIELKILVILSSLICSLLMETFLLTLFILVFLSWFLDSEDNSPPWYVLLVVFLMPATRIDSLVIMLPLICGVFLLNRKNAVHLAIVLTSGVLFQLVLMYFLYGNIFSVSSLIKADSTTLNLVKNFFNRGIGYFIRNSFAVFLIFSVLYLSITRKNTRLLISLLSISCFYVVHLLFNVQRHWYFLPVYIPLLYLVSTNISTKREHIVAASIALITTVVFCSGYFYYYQKIHRTDRANSIYFIEQINSLLDKDDIIYQIDGSGWTGLFLEPHVVNGDGLVNTYEYAERKNTNKLTGYLDEIGAGYLITNRPTKKEYIVDYHGIKIGHDDVELMVGAPFNINYHYADFKLYKFK